MPRRDLRAHLHRQGRESDQRHGLHEARRRDGAAGPAAARRQHALLHGALRQRARVLGLGGAVVPRADSRGRAGHGHASGRHPLFHDHPRSRAARHPGGLDGFGRRRVRARHGQPGAHRRSRQTHDPARRLHGPRRQESRRRHRNPLHRPASGREAVRRAAHRQERHRHRAPAHPARHGAQPDLGSDAPRARRPGAVLDALRLRTRPRSPAARGPRIPPDRQGPGPRLAAGRLARQRCRSGRRREGPRAPAPPPA